MTIKKDNNTEFQILVAAEKLFLDKGYASTSMSDIAKEAKCNQALLHYYFRTKEKLFELVFEKKINLLFSIFIEIGTKEITFFEKVKRIVEAHFDFISSNRKVPAFIINEITTNPDRIKMMKNRIGELPKSIFAGLEKELSVEINNGRIREISLIDLFYLIVSVNIMMFLISPIFKGVTGYNDEQMNQLFLKRKEENVKVVLNSIKNQ